VHAETHCCCSCCCRRKEKKFKFQGTTTIALCALRNHGLAAHRRWCGSNVIVGYGSDLVQPYNPARLPTRLREACACTARFSTLPKLRRSRGIYILYINWPSTAHTNRHMACGQEGHAACGEKDHEIQQAIRMRDYFLRLWKNARGHRYRAPHLRRAQRCNGEGPRGSCPALCHAAVGLSDEGPHGGAMEITIWGRL